jgi:acid phosphatase (class A)
MKLSSVINTNRKMRLWTAVAFVVCSMTAQAQDPTPSELYFNKTELPNGLVFLPPAPDSTSTQYLYDISQYVWGKSKRQDSLRAQQAIREVVIDIGEMAREFSPAFGMEISKEKTPAIFKVLNLGVITMRLSASKLKTTYKRRRPYVVFSEPTLIPAEEEELRNTGSYPSGHTLRGWGMALLLSEINPDAQDEILKKGYEWGVSRVIAGYHWQSDTDASRLLASACYARLHTSEDFLEDMVAARKEFAEKRKDH